MVIYSFSYLFGYNAKVYMCMCINIYRELASKKDTKDNEQLDPSPKLLMDVIIHPKSETSEVQKVTNDFL